MTTYVPGPLSGPAPPRNRSRNPFWRFRRFFFVLFVIAGAALAVAWNFASQVELTGDDFESLNETTYVCTGEVDFECGPDSAAYTVAQNAEDRIVVPYAEIPDVVIQAVIATEDKSYFDHSGVDPIGLSRAAFQVAKRKFTGSGSLQGGSTITQQYIKLTSGDSSDSVSRKAREVVRAIKFEQELADELGSKEAAKQQILERYLNRIWFGRRSYGIAAASRNYFGKDLADLTLPEAAFLAGLIRNPAAADPIAFPDEAARRRAVTLGLMEEQEFVTADQRVLAEQDNWSSLIREEANVEGLGDVKWADVGSEYFLWEARKQLETIFPQAEYYQKSLRVYTTLDPDLQRTAYDTIVNTLDPRNPDMPFGALVSLDDQGRVVAMMAGSDWDASEVNLATGRGGSGFEPGSTMKPVVLAEFIEQGFSLDSLFDNKPVTYPEWNWSPGGGTNNPVNRAKTVSDAMRWSRNSIFAQMIFQVGIEPVVDMAHRLGITSNIDEVPSIALGSNTVTPIEMATVYSTFKHEGIRFDPVYIDRIEDADGNVLCWYPTKAGDCDGIASAADGVRQGEQAVDGSVARQVNLTLVDVAANGTGSNALLVNEDGTVRATAGKTGTTNNAQHAWFSGFSCKLTTSVWMGYPGVAGQVGAPRTMSDGTLGQSNVDREAAGEPLWPLISELFPDYDEIHGGDVPALLWHDFMMGATANDEPCEIATEQSGPGQHVLGIELMTTLVPCAEPDPALVAAAQAQADSTSTSEPEGGGGEDEGALGAIGGGTGVGSGFGYLRVPTFSLRGPLPFQDGDGGGDNGGVVVPTTEPCLPIDLNGNVIDDATTTTDPAGPSTIDPNSSSTEPDDSTSSTPTSETTSTTAPQSTETTAPSSTDTQPTSTTAAGTNGNNGNGNGNGGGGGGAAPPPDSG